MDIISHIRELEAGIVSDIKNSNSILTIKKHLQSTSSVAQSAATNSLRRIFIHICDAGHLKAPSATKDLTKFQVFKKWIVSQIQGYLAFLCDQIRCGPVSLHALCTRTLLEFVKRECTWHDNSERPYFGAATFYQLLESFALAKDIDVDVLIMLKDEVFCYPDCCYCALLYIKRVLSHRKASIPKYSSANPLTQNCLDLLRVIAFPTFGNDVTVTRSTFLVNTDFVGVDETSDSDSENENSDIEDEAVVSGSVKRKRERELRFKKLSDQRDALNSRQKKRPRMSRADQLVDIGSYKLIFSGAWIAIMGAKDLTTAQHRSILKHLPDHVMPHLYRPILLADYLTSCFAIGGIVSVLALDSLFSLIVMYNLDYPNFFIALYQLCTLTVLSAKYRNRFMKLLSRSLTSTNLPLYVAASFAKRLAGLALSVPTPAALFCLAQVTQILKDHPQCLPLIHRSSSASSANVFDDLQVTDLERAHALSSSLWETCALKSHHFYGVSSLAAALESPSSTDQGSNASVIVMDDFITQTYSSLIEGELVKTKKNLALEFRKPISFLDDDSIVSNCFGGCK